MSLARRASALADNRLMRGGMSDEKLDRETEMESNGMKCSSPHQVAAGEASKRRLLAR
jgi:hypothetical protein